jgi:molybdopterin converting factor small subunit
VKLFALAKEIAGGKGTVIIEFMEGTTITVTNFRERILQIYPKLAQIPFAIVVNYRVVSELNATTHNTSAVAITPYGEVALLPPISGG